MKTLIIVAAIPVAAVLFRFIFRKFSYIFKPPLRVHLVHEAEVKGPSKAVKKFGPELTALGFTKIGAFRITEVPGLTLTAFTHTKQSVCAVLYNHPIIGRFVDMFSENEEGFGLTVSNASAGQFLDQPPGREKIFDKTLTVRNIYDRLLEKRPPGPYKRIDSWNFVEVFQTEYAKEMDWRMKRGGVTDEEVRRTAQSIGIKSDTTVRAAAEVFRAQYSEKEHTPSR